MNETATSSDAAARSVAATTGGFHELTVASVERLCADAVEVTFQLPDSAREAFRGMAGQHITIRREFDGEELRRNYSLTCQPGGDAISIGVREIGDGRMSHWLNTDVGPGDVLQVMEPTGRFVLPDTIAADVGRRVWVFVAAGSGITPIMSLIPALLERDPAAQVVLLYGNRSVDTIMYRSRLDALKSQHLERLAILHFLSRERRRAGMLDGRIDAAAIGRLPALGVQPDRIANAYLCGPAGLVDDTRGALQAAGLAAGRIHSELFDTGTGPVVRPRPEPDADVACTATVRMHGVESQVGVLAGETILDAARRQGVDAPYSCTNGVCATCRAHVDAGSATMVSNYALDADEIRDGYVLTCQALPDTPTITVDYDRQ